MRPTQPRKPKLGSLFAIGFVLGLGATYACRLSKKASRDGRESNRSRKVMMDQQREFVHIDREVD
jgi:hypothetical protein